MKQFLIIDDHEVVREGLKLVLQDLYNPCNIQEAYDEPTAVAQLKNHQFDLVIMDVQIPDFNTPAFMDYIHSQYPGTSVLIFSMSPENIYAKRFLKAGAKGYVSKNAGLTELKKAIDLVLNGRRYISESFAELLATEIGSKHTNNPFDKLSLREADIAMMLIKGKTPTEIAEVNNISLSTVGTYKTRLFEKLGVKNIVELIELDRVYNSV